MNLIPTFDPPRFFGFMLGFVIGTTFHEFMHAYSAYLLGDDTAQRQGRVTLNPAAHFDPFGFIMGILLALGIGFLAWGRPVPVNPYAFKYGKRGMAIVAAAGPITNLIFAAVLLIPFKLTLGNVTPEVSDVLFYMMSINILLFCFNLIPIPPLDGFNVLVGILPNYWNVVLEPVRRYALPILIGMIFFVPYIGSALHVELNPLAQALRPIDEGISQIFGLPPAF